MTIIARQVRFEFLSRGRRRLDARQRNRRYRRGPRITWLPCLPGLRPSRSASGGDVEPSSLRSCWILAVRSPDPGERFEKLRNHRRRRSLWMRIFQRSLRGPGRSTPNYCSFCLGTRAYESASVMLRHGTEEAGPDLLRRTRTQFRCVRRHRFRRSGHDRCVGYRNRSGPAQGLRAMANQNGQPSALPPRSRRTGVMPPPAVEAECSSERPRSVLAGNGISLIRERAVAVRAEASHWSGSPSSLERTADIGDFVFARPTSRRTRDPAAERGLPSETSR